MIDDATLCRTRSGGGGGTGATAMMGLLVSVAFMGLVVWFIVKSGNTVPTLPADVGSPFGPSVRVPALGILLSVGTYVRRSRVGMYRYEFRTMLVDVEIPGRPPFESQSEVRYPSNLARDIVPGASVELRVDPNAGTVFEIVGLGVGYSSGVLLDQGGPNAAQVPSP